MPKQTNGTAERTAYDQQTSEQSGRSEGGGWRLCAASSFVLLCSDDICAGIDLLDRHVSAAVCVSVQREVIGRRRLCRKQRLRRKRNRAAEAKSSSERRLGQQTPPAHAALTHATHLRKQRRRLDARGGAGEGGSEKEERQSREKRKVKRDSAETIRVHKDDVSCRKLKVSPSFSKRLEDRGLIQQST